MPRWDFKCDKCGCTVERVYPSVEKADTANERCSCSGRFTRLTPAPNFAISGFSAKNGYSEPQS